MMEYKLTHKPVNGRPRKPASILFDQEHGISLYAGDISELNVRVRISFREAKTFVKNYLEQFGEPDKTNDNNMVQRIKEIFMNS